MGDGAEGLVDAQSRIQDRIDELEERRSRHRRVIPRDPERERQLESLRLAKSELDRQLSATTHEVRRQQLTQALEEVNRRIEGLEEKKG
jgi:predicted  nucleic acid-binding Zn-ribbon protein